MIKANNLLVALILFSLFSTAQSSGDGPKMGMHDFGLTLGYMGMLEHKNYLQNTSSDIRTRTEFFNIHMSESLISNWWNADDDTRFLFGIRECLDVGLGRRKRTETINYPSDSFTESKIKTELIFTYEGGLGGLFRINEDMDVAFNYFFISISSFNKTSDLMRNVPQVKFRYSNYMAEITLHARTAIEFKYLPEPNEDLQMYFGLSYTWWKKKADAINSNTIKTNFIQLTCGWQM